MIVLLISTMPCFSSALVFWPHQSQSLGDNTVNSSRFNTVAVVFANWNLFVWQCCLWVFLPSSLVQNICQGVVLLDSRWSHCHQVPCQLARVIMPLHILQSPTERISPGAHTFPCHGERLSLTPSIFPGVGKVTCSKHLIARNSGSGEWGGRIG